MAIPLCNPAIFFTTNVVLKVFPTDATALFTAYSGGAVAANAALGAAQLSSSTTLSSTKMTLLTAFFIFLPPFHFRCGGARRRTAVKK